MSVVIHDDFWEAAQAMPEMQRPSFIYAICAYAIDGSEPDGNPAWLPTFIVLKDRIRMSARRKQHAKVMADARWHKDDYKDDAQASEHDDAQASEHDDAQASEHDDAQASEQDDAQASEHDDAQASEHDDAQASEHDDAQASEQDDAQASEQDEKSPMQSKSKSKSKSNKNINARANAPKHRYGAHNNVLLTDAELEKLKSQFPDWQQRIDDLSWGIATKGYSYKSHYLTILNWARNDKKRAMESQRTKGGESYDAYD